MVMICALVVIIRISYLASRISRKKDVPLSRANLRIRSKIRAILGWSKFVSAYVERDKKNLKNLIFAFIPLRF
jgi:hypothetical protein